MLHPVPVKVPHVFVEDALFQKAIVTVFDAVGVMPVIVFVAPPAVVPLFGPIFNLHENPLAVGLNTYITEVNPFVPLATFIEGLADHVPLNVHQKMAVVWLLTLLAAIVFHV